VKLEFSVDGGTNWNVIPYSHLTGNVETLVSGTYSIDWNSELDIPFNENNVRLRMNPSDGNKIGTYVISNVFSLENSPQITVEKPTKIEEASRIYGTLVIKDDYAFAWGGSYIYESDEIFLNQLKRISMDTLAISNKGSGGRARKLHTATVYNERMYIWGGIEKNEELNTMDICYLPTAYEEGAWQVGLTGGTPRKGHTAALKGSIIYFYGGRSHGVVLNTLDAYDIENNKWLTLSPGGVGRTRHTVELYNNRLYFFGGEDNAQNVLSSMDIYDITQDIWLETVETGQRGRANHASVIRNGQMIFTGGTYNDNSDAKGVLVYDIPSDKWIDLSDLSLSNRKGHNSIIKGNKIYLYFGYDDTNNEFSKSVEILNYPEQ
jgi:N-acetylneuraminic acid mutarotase